MQETAWTCYTVPELRAFGVPVDIIEAATSAVGIVKHATRSLTTEERAVWDRLVQLWLPYWDLYRAPDALARPPGSPVLRVDLLALVECMIQRPHQRYVLSRPGDDGAQ